MLAHTEADPVSSVETRIERLTAASLRRVIEPEVDVAGSVGPGMVVAKELLSVADLDLDLTDDQWAALSREELASILDAGVRFESVLIAGFGLMMAWKQDLVDPRVTYVLHEIGEETRHQRLFQRIVGQIRPTAKNPLAGHWLVSRIDRWGQLWVIAHPALLYVMVLGGEEIPDLFQKLASEHPDTDPFLARVNRYHRQEEARHLSYARKRLPEMWSKASFSERVAVRFLGPTIIRQMFSFLVHPGVYETIGLDGWATWKAVNKLPERQALLAEGARPVLAALLDAGILSARRLPKAWRVLCQVDTLGVPSLTRASAGSPTVT